MSKEVRMSRQRTHIFLVATLALMVVFTLASCQKLNVKYLQGNFHFNKANELFKNGKFTKAVAEYELALKYNPSLVQAHRFLGESYKSLFIPGRDTPENNENAAKALEALRKAFEIDPNNKDIIYSLGDMYDKMKNFPEAEKMYLRIVELEPGNMNNYYVVAEFYKRYAIEKPELRKKALDMYLRRIETDPESVQGYAYMYNYYDLLPVGDNKEKFDRAFYFEQKRLALEPKSAEMYYTIGVNRFNKAYQLQNFLSQAEREAIGADAERNLLKAIEIDPAFPLPYSYMKILYINVHAVLYPEKEGRYKAEADRFGEKFDDARKRQIERMKLEKELKKTG
jgi:tetratricopeptide (TPR) repeat protein